MTDYFISPRRRKEREAITNPGVLVMCISREVLAVGMLLVTLWLTGCGPTSEEPSQSSAQPTAPRRQEVSIAPSVSDREVKKPEKPRETVPPVRTPSEDKSPPRRTFADLLNQPTDAIDRWMPHIPRVKVDKAKVKAAGIRRIEGRYLTLYTDFPPDRSTNALPAVFDQAVEQWQRYFGVAPSKVAKWHWTGFLIHDRELFRRVGLLPGNLPPFQHAFCLNTDFWVYEKPSEYFNRHQVLHEGTHCFMNAMFGACGPPWFMEGTAELLATHRVSDDRAKVKLNQVPRDRDQTPLWGRIKLVKDAVAAGRGRSLKRVLNYRFDAYLETEPYAWSWAAALFLDRHPKYGPTFRQLHRYVLTGDLTRRFMEKVGDDWPALERQWNVFLDDLDYGCDVKAMLIDPTPGRPLDGGRVKVDVSARRGWQNSGLRVEQGKTYRLKAEGRYQIGDKPKIWWCEPNGVTIRYYRGRPLGMLLAMVLPDDAPIGKVPTMPEPIEVGLGTTLVPKKTGTLYFRINESPADWNDNAGELSVEIQAE